MKKNIIILFLMLFVNFSYSQTFISNCSKLYIYDSTLKDYIISDTLMQNVEIYIDTIFNKMYFVQDIDNKPFCLSNVFNIENIDYNNKENKYHYFLKEFNREYIVNYLPNDSSITMFLENKYLIFYNISQLCN